MSGLTFERLRPRDRVVYRVEGRHTERTGRVIIARSAHVVVRSGKGTAIVRREQFITGKQAKRR